MPSVNIPYVGVVQFPDTMSGDQISEVIRTQIMPNATRPVGGEQPGSTSVADRVQNVLGTQLGLVGLQDLVSKPSPLMGSLAKGIEGLSNFYPSYKASELDPIVQDRKAKYGQAYENAPPEKKDEFLRTEAKLNEYLGQMKQSQADVKAIEEKFGKDPLAQKLDKLQATPEYQKADAWEQTKMTGAQYLKNLDEFPAYAANIGLGSLPQSIAMALSARFGSVLGRTPGITAGGASSAFMEYGNNYIELREQGFTADEANKKAAVKSGIIGLFDAASIGSAGKIAERMFDGTAKKVLKETAKDVGKEVGKQAAFGAAGEGLGSYASNQPVDPRAIFEEAIGEIAGAPAEAAATYKAKREEAQAAARPAPPAAPTPAASPISTPPAPTINTVNGLVNPEDLEQPTAPPPAINPELKQRAEMRVEQIEKGEAELNGRNVNPLARDLGIDVPKGQKPEETLNEVKQVIGLPTQPVEAPAAEVVHAVPMGTNTEYQVIKTPTGYTANLLDKDSGNYVPGSTRIFKTEVFGENAETKAMEFVVEEAKKAQPYMTPEEKAQTEAAPQEAAVQPEEPQIPEEAYYEPADELADIDYEELEQGLKAQAEQAKEEVAPKEEGAAPDAIPVLMGLQDAAFQNQAPKNAEVKDWLSEHGLIDVQGDKAKITPLGQKLNEQLNPVGIGAQPLTTEEANNIVKEFTHFNRPAKKEEAPKTQAQINQERQQAQRAAAEQKNIPETEVDAEALQRIKDNLVRFASGMTALKDLEAGTKARGSHQNHGIGVDVGLLSANGIQQIAHAVLNWQVPIFVDSGAFSNFRKELKGNKPKPLDFDKILAKYDAITQTIAEQNEAEETEYPRPMFVMPDIVGNQTASLDLIKTHKDWIKGEVNGNLSQPIIPIQKGEKTLAQVYKQIVDILGTDNFSVGIPSNAKAVSREDLIEFLKEAQPKKVHFLGAASDSKLNPLLAIVAHVSPKTDVTADASKVRSSILNGVAQGKSREDAIMDALSEEEDPGAVLAKFGPEEKIEEEVAEEKPVKEISKAEEDLDAALDDLADLMGKKPKDKKVREKFSQVDAQATALQNAPILNEQVEKLSEPEIKTLEVHYKAPRKSSQFLSKLTEDIIRLTNEGAEAIDKAVRGIVKKLQAGLLSTAIILNPAYMSQAAVVIMPTKTQAQTVQVRATLPSQVKGMSEGAKRAYEILQPTMTGDKYFTIVDKPTATAYVFNPNGSLVTQSKVLLGKAFGDFYIGKAQFEQNRVTPAGLFNVKAETGNVKDYDGRTIYTVGNVKEGWSAAFLHTVYTKESDGTARLNALTKEGAADSRYSHGCINGTPEFMQSINDVKMDQSKVFVVPDNQNMVDAFISNTVPNEDLTRITAQPKTRTIVQTIPNVSKQGAVTAPLVGREEEVKTQAQINRERQQAKKLKAKVKPTVVVSKEAETKAKEDLMDALSDLSMLMTKGTRLNMMPEEEQKLLPILTRLMDAAFRLGYHKFKQAAKYVLDTIRSKLGDDIADQITLDYLQGAYIGMAGRYPEASSKKEVVSIETLDELTAEEKPEVEYDLETTDGKFKVAQAVRDHFMAGFAFKDINEARKFIADLTGQKIEANTQSAKQADEAIEVGVVLSAQAIAKKNRPATEIYDGLVSLYNRQPNLAVRSSTSIREQAYSTPAPLAYVASQLAGITKDTTVYEPTAGNGMLLIAANPNNVIANELNSVRHGMLTKVLPGAEITNKNALQNTPHVVDAVIANPPFGAIGETWESNGFKTREIDHAIVMKSLNRMKQDGKAVLIVGGVRAENEEARREGYRSSAKRNFYYNLYKDYNVTDHFTVSGDMYSKQGASYPVDVIVIDGKTASSRALPASDLPQVISSYEELKEKLNERPVVSKPNISASGADVSAGPAGGTQPQTVGGSAVGQGNKPSPAGERPAAGGRPNVPENEPSRGGQPEPTGRGAGEEQLRPANEPQRGNAGEPVPSTGERKPSGEGVVTENKPAELGGTSVVSGKRVESGLADRRGQETETGHQVAYKPYSQASSVGTLVPKAMAESISNSLANVEAQVGNVDEYVAQALNMDVETLRENFSAEQVDALTLAIRNAETGKGFIIGDQTGIGKGRVVAAMIKYSIENGKIPIFVTEKPNLYSDMIRDLDDIGMTDEMSLDTNKPKIIITNSGTSVPYTLIREVNGETIENELILKAPSSGKDLDELLKKMSANDSLGNYKVIFTTYNQLQTVRGQETERQRFIKNFGKDNYMIFDESHNAGGAGETQARTKDQREAAKEGKGMATGRASFVRELVENAFGTFFSSATYAKRPDVMDLYSSTDMKLAVDKIADLSQAIKNGGIPMQQIVANMLTQAGQYIRRERTFAGVSYNTVETKVSKETAENMAESMRDILAFSRAKELIVKDMQKELDKGGAAARVEGEKTTIQSANFGSTMHNLINQMLLSLKAEETVKFAIERIKAGEKPVITVANTMGSFLQSYAEDMGINIGDPVNLSFKDLYIRYLEKQRIIKIKKPGNVIEEYRMTDDDLGPQMTEQYNKIKNFINNAGFGAAPMSPIDYIHSELHKAGYKTEEITGRTLTLNYESGTPILTSRSANIKQRVDSVKAFNSGAADVIILNQAGSTGISLHASKKVKDQRKRHMIIAQPEANIDTHMQMLGRVHRTGQIIPPSYSQMMADIPAEMRPAAILLKKMASLNANTTASRKSAVTAEGAVDFVNDYGGQVAQEYLRDNPDVYEALGGKKIVELIEDPSEATEGDIRKLSGYIPILPIKQQEEIYNDIVERYNDLIERENSMGNNKLEAKASDLDAKTVSSKPITEAKDDPSIFAQPAFMERVDVKRTVKPFSKQEVLDQIKDNLNGKTATQHSDELDQSLTARAKEYAQNYVAEIKAKGADEVRTEHAKGQLNLQWQNIRTILRTYPIGSQIRIANKQGVLINGVITDIENKGKTKNPTAGSDWKMIVALANGDAKSTPIMFSQIGSTYQLQKENSVAWFNPEKQDNEYISVMDLFDKGATERREKRWMVTGNILGGFAAVGNVGQIMTYTKADGTTGQGVLMPRAYDFEKAQKDAPIRLKTAADAMRFINEARGVVASPDIVLMINRPYGGYQFKVPKSKKVGGTYFLDKGLTDITGDFYNGVATVYSEADAQRAIDYILNVRGETLIASSPKEEARKMFAPKTVALESIMPKESVKEQTRRIRNEKIREFQGLRQRLGNITRKFIKGEGTLDLQRNASNLEQAAKELQLDIDFMKERAQNLTPEAFYSKALKDYAEGNISKDVLDVVSYIYKKSPSLLSGIKLSVRTADKGRERAAGNFNPIQRIISLFKGYGSEDASVLRHELMHSLEQMMTPQVREAIIDNWHQSLQAAMKKNTDPKAQKYFAKLLEYLENPNQETLDAATDAMPNHDFYQYVNPSEYWAVNAEKLMAAKMGTPWHRFVQFTKMLFEALKSAVGFDSRYPVYKAFNNLIKGEGERLNRSALAEFVMNSGNRMTFLEDIKKTDDLLQKHERPHAPIKLSNTALDAMMGGVQKAKDVAAKMAANPAQPIINMVGSLDRGILYTRIKNVWYGAGLEAADTERYNRQLRDSEGRAITSIAVNNALRAGHIGTQVMLQGRLQFNPITQMFQAVKDKMSLANVISLKHDLVTKIGAQRAADVIQAYFEAKRSRSINQEYSERSANLENLLLEQANPDLSVEKQLALIDKVEEAREDLRSIGIALQKVNMSEEAIDDFIALEKDYPELRKMMDNWSAVNKNMIDNMEFAKIISKQRADTLRKIQDYVPWYRIQDDMSDVHIPVGVARGLTNVGREKKFKEGRTELDIDDIVDNMIHNVMMITRNSLKNYAANRIAQEYAVRNEKNKIKVFPRENHAAGIVNILVNGRRINIQIADPLIAESVIGMENVIIPMNNILAFFANGLRRSITFSGIFQVKQLFMDAPTAALVSGVRNPVALYGGVFGSFIKGLTQSDPIVELLKSYGIGGYKSAARSPEHEAKIEIGLLNKSAFARATSILDKIADASDYAQRRAIYKRVLAETGDEMQAITQAANVIDFLKRGSGATSQFLNRTIAFMNAYAQQIDVLTQALAGNGLKGMSRQKALTRLAITGGLLAGTVLLYSMAVGDDDEYNKMDDQTKMRNFVIPRKLMKTIGYDHTLLIPMHTSASFFFKAIPELLYNKITKEGTKDAMDNTRLRTALKEAAVDSLFGPLMSGPIPTGIKAPVEIILNHNFFTGGTVTPTGMKNLEAFRQYNASTSELGKIVSKLSTVPFTDHRVLNPIEADHFMRGLAGSVAAAAMWGSNLFSNSKPAPEERDNIMYGSFIAPEVPRGREDLFYDLQQRSDTAMGTFKDLIKKGHEAEANQYFKDHEGAIKAYGFTSQVGKQGLVKINEEIRRLSDLPEDRMSPQEKREQINFYKKKKEEILEQTIKFRESAGL